MGAAVPVSFTAGIFRASDDSYTMVRLTLPRTLRDSHIRLTGHARTFFAPWETRLRFR